MQRIEYRAVLAADLRMVGDGPDRRLVGYAAVFQQPSEDLGGFREIIAPGAFSDVLGQDVRALFNHDPNYVLGRTPTTLALREDPRGLVFEVTPPETQWARDLAVSVERGDISQASFGFRVKSQTWAWDKPEGPDRVRVRTVNKVAALSDVSVVTFPAYPQTAVGLRGLPSEEELRALAEEARAALPDPVDPVAAPPSLDLYERRLRLAGG